MGIHSPDVIRSEMGSTAINPFMAHSSASHKRLSRACKTFPLGCQAWEETGGAQKARREACSLPSHPPETPARGTGHAAHRDLARET